MVRLPLELLLCLLLGVVLGTAMPWLPGWLAPVLMRWGIPLSLAALLLRASPSLTLLRVGLLGLLVPLLSLLILRLPPLRQRLQDRVLMLGAAFGNTGYWGLPVALALLPPPALATVIAYDMAGTVITWSVGPLLLRGGRGGRNRLLHSVLASPALQGFALFLLLTQTPWCGALAQWLWWPARLVFWLALALVGMRLALCVKERAVAFSQEVSWALGFKLLVVPVIVWLLATLLRLPPLDRTALVLQGAAPTALSVLLLAEAERQAVPLASSVVLISTVAAMVTVPLWWNAIR
ncbi:MAG: AEC family transporter [Cyanobacteriota bacterium]|jgi:predicted permease